MTDYKKMYFLLFNKITDIIKDLQDIQQQAEEMYIVQEESSLRLVELSNKEKSIN
ncbi:MAG: hypothetical protein AB7E42_01605 [Anaerotignaceae bacterium]